MWNRFNSPIHSPIRRGFANSIVTQHDDDGSLTIGRGCHVTQVQTTPAFQWRPSIGLWTELYSLQNLYTRSRAFTRPVRPHPVTSSIGWRCPTAMNSRYSYSISIRVAYCRHPRRNFTFKYSGGRWCNRQMESGGLTECTVSGERDMTGTVRRKHLAVACSQVAVLRRARRFKTRSLDGAARILLFRPCVSYPRWRSRALSSLSEYRRVRTRRVWRTEARKVCPVKTCPAKPVRPVYG